MRTILRLLVPAVAIVMLTPSAFAGTVTSLTVTGGNTHALSEGKITLTGGADFTGDETGPTQVFEDAVGDSAVLAELTPPYQDLIAGFISETASSLTFTWQVVDFPDPPAVLPLIAQYYWDFSLQRPGAVDPVSFQITATFDARGRGVGDLASSCTTDDTGLTMCNSVPNHGVQVVADGVANTISATVSKGKLKDYEGGGALQAVDGAVMQEVENFQGIGAYTSFVVVISGLMADLADMTPYGLGRHVEAVLAPPGFSDDDLTLLWPGSAAPAGSGSYTVNVPLAEKGSFDAAVRACTGGHCGVPVRQAVTIT
jgi:hypothetical protein